jgi:hypothetical protein
MSENILFPLKYELDHIAGDKIQKKEEQDHIDVHQGENHYVTAQGQLAAHLKEVALEVGEENYEGQGDDNDDSFSSPPPLFCGTIGLF